MENKRELTFETGMEELEGLAQALESGELALEESLVAYDRAVKLHRQLREMLDRGDARIRLLTEEGEAEIEEDDIR